MGVSLNRHKRRILTRVIAVGSVAAAVLTAGQSAVASTDVTGDRPCADGCEPIPSHLGYLRDQELLHSQGCATVSISANGINARDLATEDADAQARSSLVRRHVAR